MIDRDEIMAVVNECIVKNSDPYSALEKCVNIVESCDKQELIQQMNATQCFFVMAVQLIERGQTA